ncbi:MAG: hypothetical protein R2864_09640 [Syntrophotaleaceae bacterium]
MSYKWLMLLKALGVSPLQAGLKLVLPVGLPFKGCCLRSAEAFRGYLMSRYARRWDVIVGSMIVERLLAVFAIVVLSSIASFVLVNVFAENKINYLNVSLVAFLFLDSSFLFFPCRKFLGKSIVKLVPTKKEKPFLIKFTNHTPHIGGIN